MKTLLAGNPCDLAESDQRDLASDTDAGCATLAALTSSRHPRIRRLVASHGATPELALDILALDSDRDARRNAVMQIRLREIHALDLTWALAV